MIEVAHLVGQVGNLVLLPLKFPFALLNLIPTGVRERVPAGLDLDPRNVIHRGTF